MLVLSWVKNWDLVRLITKTGSDEWMVPVEWLGSASAFVIAFCFYVSNCIIYGYPFRKDAF